MNQIRTSALIGLGALGILFGRKMPGVQVIADEARIARYAAQPVVCNGEECRFSYVTPAQGKPVDLLLVAVKATVLDQAIADMKNFVGPDTVILSVLNGITSEEHIETAYPGRTLWSVAIGMDATRSGRTLVFNQAGKIQFGERDGAMPTFNPDGMPSMRQDVLAKRPTEVEEFAGVVRARAKKYGMPTPANDFFYARIQEIEAGYCK